MADQRMYEQIRAGSSTDGRHVTIDLGARPFSVCIQIPTENVPEIAAMLLEAAAAATTKSGRQEVLTLPVTSLAYGTYPKAGPVLKVGLHEGAPPLALRMSKRELVQFALGVLEAEGVLKAPSRGNRQ